MNVSVRVSLAVLTSLAMLGQARDGHAQSAGVQTGKSIVGGALMGAEVVLLTEAALGVKPGWAYIVGGVAGGGAGAVGGYYLLDGSSNRPSSFLLAGSLALAIPTVICVLIATHFEPEDYRQDVAPEDEFPLEGEPLPGEGEPLPEEDEPLDDDPPPPPAARLELPSVGLAQAFSREELSTFHVRQVTELHLSVLRGVF
jgi:hypothetical protein